MRPAIALSEDAEAKLRTVMAIRGLASLESAAEFAFAQAERKALLIKKLYANAMSDEVWAGGSAFFSEGELDSLRAMALPAVLRNDAA